MEIELSKLFLRCILLIDYRPVFFHAAFSTQSRFAAFASHTTLQADERLLTSFQSLFFIKLSCAINKGSSRGAGSSNIMSLLRKFARNMGLIVMCRVKGTVILVIWKQVVLMILYTTGLACVHNFLYQFNFQIGMVSFMGIATALLSIFRTNTGNFYFKLKRNMQNLY